MISRKEGKYKFSIIIPVLNEKDRINDIIENINKLTNMNESEIIIVDGDKTRSTINTIIDKNVVAVVSEKGRGKQMNAGANIAKGQILLFLHADTALPENAFKDIEEILKNGDYDAGAFNLSFNSKKLIYSVFSFLASIRSRLTRIPYGDQAIFIKKNIFEKIGGYKEIPLMEDVELMEELKRTKSKIHILKSKVKTSTRRWERNGIFNTTLKNIMISIFYILGVSPDKLVKIYYK